MRGCLFILLFLSTQFTLAEVNSAHLSEQTLKRFELVPEFAFIIQEAEKLGVKVYLFGGTASAFAHYVRWDLEREAGDDKYQAERFDYDFTNIYRRNQDLDIVVDGSPEQADQLKAILKTEYPHFIGDREAWEVRLLRESQGDKRALVGDKDFRRQHSDTNSTGILLLNPDPGGIVYNDLLSWGSPESDFLKDVAAAKIKFLHGDEHEKTQRYKDGLNPPVLAAIRYLAKLAQYEVVGTDEDLNTVTQIISKTNFNELSDYAKKKASEFALKTLLNSPNSEYAWDLLETTGLRKKLIQMDGERFQKQESLSWWMNKEPLRSKEFGTTGKTARELFKTEDITVSHETNSFQAYDNITRSSRGEANAFISRDKVIGEAAVYGNGFYTRIGQNGARGTGLTIRFKLNPDAREGADFDVDGDFIIVKNKNALTLIQENLNLSIVDYFKLLNINKIGSNDKGLLEKYNRKFNRIPSDSQDFQEAFELLKSLFFIADDFPEDFKYTDDFPEPSNFSDLTTMYSLKDNYYMNTISVNFFQYMKPNEMKVEWLKAFILNGNLDARVTTFISRHPHPRFAEVIELLLERGNVHNQIIKEILSNSFWSSFPEWVETLIASECCSDEILIYVLSEEHWSGHTEWIQHYVDKQHKYIDNRLIMYVFSKDFWQNHPSLKNFILRIIKDGEDNGILRYVLSNKHWQGESFEISILENLIEHGDRSTLKTMIEHVLTKNVWATHPKGFDFIQKIIAKKPFFDLDVFTTEVIKNIFYSIFSKPEWIQNKDFIDYIELILEKPNSTLSYYFIEYVFSQDHWADFPRSESYINTLRHRANIKTRMVLVEKVLSNPAWFKKPFFLPLLENLIETSEKALRTQIIDHIFKQDFWLNHKETPRLLQMILDIEHQRYQIDSQTHYMHIVVKDTLTKQLFYSHQNEHAVQLFRQLISLADEENLLNIAKSVVFESYPRQDKSNLNNINKKTIIQNHIFEILELLVEKKNYKVSLEILHSLNSYGLLREDPRSVQLIKTILTQHPPHWRKENKIQIDFIEKIMSRDFWRSKKELLDFLPSLMEHSEFHGSLVSYVFAEEFWLLPENFDLFFTFVEKIKQSKAVYDLSFALLQYSRWQKHPRLFEILEILIKKGIRLFSKDAKTLAYIAMWISWKRGSLSTEQSIKLIKLIASKANSHVLKELNTSIFSKSEWSNLPEIEAVFSRKSSSRKKDAALFKSLLTQEDLEYSVTPPPLKCINVLY